MQEEGGGATSAVALPPLPRRLVRIVWEWFALAIELWAPCVGVTLAAQTHA